MSDKERYDGSNKPKRIDIIDVEENWSQYWGEDQKREVIAREDARKLARHIGDQEWQRGNTKYAFEAYEAACVAPSEILAKAEALLKAENLALCWENAIKHLIEDPVKAGKCRIYETGNLLGYADVLTGACVYCPSDDCYFCSQKRVLNRRYANEIHDALGWEHPDPKERENNGRNSTRQKVIEDRFSEHFLYSDKPRQKYRAAAVAALKLVNRLERIYVPGTRLRLKPDPRDSRGSIIEETSN